MPSCQWLVAAGLFVVALTAGAQYNITTLLIEGGQIPNSTNVWNVNPGVIPTDPLSISGKYVAFVQCTCNGVTEPTDGVWIEDWTTKTFIQIVAPGDVPSGPGETGLISFGPYALIAGSQVVFLGYTDGGDGYYSASLRTHKITVIADQNTTLPGFSGAGTYSLGNSNADLPQSDGTHFAFQASVSGGSVVFVANLDGSDLMELAGQNTPLPADGFCNTVNTGASTIQPRVFGSNAVFDLSSFYPDFLYIEGISGAPPPVCLMDSSTPLPGGVAFNYASLMNIDNLHLYFDANGNNTIGMFQQNFDGSELTTLLNPTQSIAGVSPPFSSDEGIAAENGTVVFSVAGLSPAGNTATGLFAFRNGSITRVAGTGDILNGSPGNTWLPPVGPNSISDGRIVFSFGNPNLRAIYLATLTACATDETSGLEVTQTPPHFNAATGYYFSKITITNPGPAAIGAPVSAVFDGLVPGVVNYGVQAPELLNKGTEPTTCIAPLGEAYVVVNGGNALGAGATATIELEIADPAQVPVSFTTRVVSGKPR